MKKRLLSLFVVLCLIAAVLTGCSNGEEAPVTTSTEFPPKEPVTLTYWVKIGNLAGTFTDFNEMGMYKELEKKTNVKIDFTHPVQGQETEQFNIMIASSSYPDIIEYMGSYPGGATKAYNDGVIIRLNEYLEEYAPNLSKILKEYPELLPHIQDENGNIFTFPLLRTDPVLRQAGGPIFRKDWLAELNLPIPETIDEWESTLLAFKENKKLTAPLIFKSSDIQNSIIMGAYGIKSGFFVDDGVVKYGQYTEEYKKYLEKMHKWYELGIIDQEFTTLNTKAIDSKVLNGEGGAYIGTLGNGLQRFLTLATEPGFDLQPVPYPVLNKGDIQDMTTLTPVVASKNVAVSTSCKHPEIAIQWLDYIYGKEGHMLANFGVEGESYEMIDGYPTYTKLLTDNPDGKSFSTMGMMYARSFSTGPYVQDTRYGEQFFAMPVQKEAVEVWGKFANEAEAAGHNFVGILSEEEVSKTTSKLTEIQTFANESFVKFVRGITPLDEFDEYIKELEKMGIKDIIKVYQDAQDRFVKKYPNYKIPADMDLSGMFIE